MENRDRILERLKKETESIEIPESLSPEHMRHKLESIDNGVKEKKTVENLPKKRTGWWKVLVPAACICILAGMMWFANEQKFKTQEIPKEDMMTEAGTEESIKEEELFVLAENTATYEQIYTSMNQVWTERENFFRGEVPESAAGMTDGMVVEEAPAADMGIGIMENTSANANKEMASTEESEKMLFGETNVQTTGVDEGDIVKNDGRYLYQVISKETEEESYPAIQIIDTKDGLKELSVIECHNAVRELYVWKDLLIVIESGYLEPLGTPPAKQRMMIAEVIYDINEYHEISFYDLADRTKPEKIKNFTLQGTYESSRIADGYFYGFSRFHAGPGNGEKDFDAYVPSPDGVRLLENNIVLPQDSKGTQYLVLVSVDLENPTKFIQSAGIITDSELYYVSENSIYITDYRGSDEVEGISTDKTALMKFSYNKGRFYMEAEGEVAGTLNDTFSLNEDSGYLRVVSTVWEYEKELMVDDRTGEELGFSIRDSRQTNALYVLDEKLKLVGKIEGLAENEHIYSARFLGDTGYFVTFKQVDPLFAVDLSDPKNPKILDELKVSGFSEYLHFYSEDRLLGIGMEADEETGRTEGMKLSMFDISDPRELKEIAKEPLSEYYYSDALYNHRAVMISPAANIFGFAVEGNSRNGEYLRNYLVYSYTEEEFVQRLKLEIKNKEDSFEYYTVRGTFIGDAFYLLCGNGKVEKYDLNSGELLESLNP